MVPEVRERAADGRRTAHFAGGEHVTDYRGPVSRAEHRAAVVDAWLASLADEADFDELIAGGLAEDAGWAQLLCDRASRAGLEVVDAGVDGVCPRIDLTGGWDAYLQRISAKQRHEIRRKARKLAREGGVVKLVAVDTDDLEEAMTTFIAMNQSLDGDKGRFFVDERMQAFFLALVQEFGPDRVLRMHRLDVDGSPAALTVSLIGGADLGEWRLYNSAFDRHLAGLAPGMVLVGELVRIAAEEGFAVFDLLRGDEPYKYRYGATDRRVCKVTARPRATA
ncbi:MAG: GNAT family N-acetyltransferase [Actinobacteria bacterium]|nr:GNAT family N-acetyltransferase [Actinomycetota bacterium]